MNANNIKTFQKIKNKDWLSQKNLLEKHLRKKRGETLHANRDI